MVLPKIYIPNKTTLGVAGFTLIEVIIVVAIMGMVLSCSLFFTTNQLKRESLLSQRLLLVTALQTARADAMNNVKQIAHGVVLYPASFDGFVIFSGLDYASSNGMSQRQIPSVYATVLASSSPREIVFSQLSGDANYSGEIILLDNTTNSSTSITINYEGKIGW